MTRRILLIGLICALVSVGVVATTAQENVVLTVGIPQYLTDIFNDAYFEPFRAANPGVDIVFVTDDGSGMYPLSPALGSLDEYLNTIDTYTRSADVLLVFDNPAVSIESTRAGYWLDIAPLVAADPDLSQDRFYPPMWRAFRWDGSMWAMPTSGRLTLLTYNPVAFNSAALSYPNAGWTIQDFVSAAIALTQTDGDGNPTNPGCFCDEELLYYSLLGSTFTDIDGSPRLDTPELAALLDAWMPATEQIFPIGGYSTENVPMLMSGAQGLTTNAAIPFVVGEMPNNATKAYVEGFGISAGTAHPEAAFALVKFLAQNPRNPFGDPTQFPAMRDAMVTTSRETIPSDFSPENWAILQASWETAAAPSDFLFANYILRAQRSMREQGLDALSALQEAQANAMANLEAAANWTGAELLTVATPAPQPVFGSDEIVLNFGVSLGYLYNQSEWQRIADEFAASDPQIGQIAINIQGLDYEGFMAGNDCYYLNYDGVDPYRVGHYINLDPFMDADPAFRSEDFLRGTLEAMQMDGRTWGYPLSVATTVIVYDPKTFEQAGVPIPGSSWTVSEFADAMNALQNADLGMPVISPHMADNADYLMLIAAYGGLPIDYRTSPPTIDFTAPDTVSAIQQVLDLAKTDGIGYSKLGTFIYSGMPSPGAISPVELSGYVDYVREYETVNYPQGSQYQTVAMGDVGGLYISAGAQNPDACYRWMSTIAAHPELLPMVMPANLNALNSNELITNQGDDATATYQELARLINDPNTLIIRSRFGGGGTYSVEMFFVNQWLNRAFDAYVLDGGDLESALADAQQKASDFLTCTNNLPLVEESSAVEALNARSDAVVGCMELVDPFMAAERLSSMPTE